MTELLFCDGGGIAVVLEFTHFLNAEMRHTRMDKG